MKYVDTDVLVYWATDHPEHGDTATKILRHIELNEKGCTSALSLYLFDTVLANLDIEDYDFGAFLSALGDLRNLKLEAVNEKVYARAADVKRELDVPMDVAVGIVVATDRKADTIYSNNPDYDKGPVRRVFRAPA